MAALVWCCLLGLTYVYRVEFCGPIISARGLPLPPFNRTRSLPCSFFLHLHQAETCHLAGWPLNLEWPSFYSCLPSALLTPLNSYSGIACLPASSLNSRWFYLVVVGLGAPISSPH